MSESGYSVRFREYAEAIWELEEAGIRVLQVRIARWLGVSPASVSEMVRRMQAEGLVIVGEQVSLTDEGRHLAAVVVRRHRLAERFLSEVLKLPWAKVHEEAEVWETMISDDVEKAMWAVMDDPKTCPHGNPIPGAGYRPPMMKPLAEMGSGETLRLERISEELELDFEMMRFLDENQIRPDSRIRMVQKDPYGAITVEVSDRQVGIGVFASERLFVSVE
jgi:DtxR family Mn-dependent transcriptional regulator